MVDTKVSDFYDDFSLYQQKIAYNERHFQMLDRLLKLGLNSESTVLELGCGIGIISSLILKVVKKGKVVSVDISPKSIELAKQNNQQANVEFYVGDIAEFDPGETEFDFVTLFDVLEHVPVESHPKLFSGISKAMPDSSKLLINIPTQRILEYFHEHHPEELQIIDQPVNTLDIIGNAEKCGLRLISFEEYGLWYEEETRFFLFEKSPAFKLNKHVPSKPSLIRRLQNKLEFYW